MFFLMLFSGNSINTRTDKNVCATENSIRAIQQQKPNLVLLDMKLNDGNGLDVLRAFPNHDNEFAHIVLSGYAEFMPEAWEFAPKGYVIKPFDDDKLRTAITFAINKIKLLAVAQVGADGTGVEEYIEVRRKIYTIENEFLMVKADKQVTRFQPRKEILYCSSGRDNTVFHLGSDSRFVAPEHLGVWEKVLAHFDFVRIHRSFLLNLAFFRAIVHDDKDGLVVLTNGIKIRLSRTYKPILQKSLDQYYSKNGGLSGN